MVISFLPVCTFSVFSVDMLSFSSLFQFAVGPLFPPPSLFSACYIFVDIVFMLSFFLVTTDPCQTPTLV